MANGVVYIATGRSYVAAAAMSIGSLRGFYKGPVMLLTDTATRAPYLLRLAKHFGVELVVHDTGEPHVGRSSRVLKTQVATLCHYGKALFLDADTWILKPIEHLWGTTTRDAPIAMTLSPAYKTVGELNSPYMLARTDVKFAEEYKMTMAVASADTPYYSSSTIVWYRTQQLLELFRVWHEEWQRLRISDMPALARAIARVGVKVVRLSPRFNSRNRIEENTVIFTARPERMAAAHAKRPDLCELVGGLMKG